MRGGVLRPGEGSDPDELAILTAALVRQNGNESRIVLEGRGGQVIEEGEVVAFVVERVWNGGSAVVGRFPCYPFKAPAGYVKMHNDVAAVYQPLGLLHGVARAAVALVDRLLGTLQRTEVALSPHEKRLVKAVQRLRRREV